MSKLVENTSPTGAGNLRAKLERLTTIIAAARSIMPGKNERLRELAERGDYEALTAARQGGNSAPNIELARLEIERLQTVIALATVEEPAALAERLDLQRQVEEAAQARVAAAERLQALFVAEHASASRWRDIVRARERAALELESWLDYSAGTTREERMRRHGIEGGYNVGEGPTLHMFGEGPGVRVLSRIKNGIEVFPDPGGDNPEPERTPRDVA